MKRDWYQEVVNRKELLLADVERLLRIPSVREDELATPECPVGPGPKAALDELMQMAQEAGFTYETAGPLVGHIDFGCGEELFGLLGHVDVVPVGDGWESAPFTPTYRDGKLIARGALDDKGPLVAAFFAMKLLKELGLTPQKTVRLIVGTDEESEWQCLHQYQKQFPIPKTGFVPDAYFPIVNGEKGNGTVTIAFSPREETKEGFVLQRFEAGLRENMVPDKACALLQGEDLGSVAEDFISYLSQEEAINGQVEQTVAGLQLTLRGRSAHGSKPDAGVNAATYLARFLEQYTFTANTAHQFLKCLGELLHEDFNGRQLGIFHEDACMGVLTSNVGLVQYEAATGGTIACNIRYPRGIDWTEKEAILLARVAEYGALAHFTDKQPPHYVAGDHPLVQTLLGIYHEQTGLPAYERVIGGATYARLMPEGVAFGALFPDTPDTMHQANEFIFVEQLLRTCAMYAQALYELTCVPTSVTFEESDCS